MDWNIVLCWSFIVWKSWNCWLLIKRMPKREAMMIKIGIDIFKNVKISCFLVKFLNCLIFSI